MNLFAVGSTLGLGTVVASGATLRGRSYALFVGIVLGVHTALSGALVDQLAFAGPLYVYLQAVTFLHFLMLIRPRHRPPLYRYLVSLPAHAFLAGTFLALPWAVAQVLPGAWVPYLAAFLGLIASHRPRQDDIALQIDQSDAGPLARTTSPPAREGRPLRIVQITDPHLGPTMSPERLRGICERAVAAEPDLVLLTGDYLTMETQASSDPLATALEPLRALEGRTFACLGNHDLEAPRTVAEGLARAGVALLVDQEVTVETPAGLVQIVGMDFAWRDRKERSEAVFRGLRRPEGALRVVLLHDPGAFTYVPDGEGDLVLAGHTHGGQLGLVSLGSRLTALSWMSGRLPDHGLWAKGRNRLYVHRGTGHYGFPVRLGVPPEEGVISVRW